MGTEQGRAHLIVFLSNVSVIGLMNYTRVCNLRLKYLVGVLYLPFSACVVLQCLSNLSTLHSLYKDRTRIMTNIEVVLNAQYWSCHRICISIHGYVFDP